MQKQESDLPVVLIDDEEDILFGASYLLKSHGIQEVIALSDAREIMPFLQSKKAGVIVLDLFMPHLPGTELLPEIVQNYPEVPVIVMTASQEIKTAISCMKEGAYDYLVKPVEESRFVSCVRCGLEIRGLRREIRSLRHSLIANGVKCPECFSRFITCQREMQVLFGYIEAIADSSEPVMITGETGTGKRLCAQALHKASGRSGEMVSLNVVGLDDKMLTDTLFGHTKGAFIGADRDKEGIITKATGGTLFLDEIGNLNMSFQLKLLRLLKDSTYCPLGSDISCVSDARIVVATNQDLHAMMVRGEFLQDLFFSLSRHLINVPSLRDRPDDLPLLVRHFIVEAAQSLNKPIPTSPTELLTLLSGYEFPGNIRELRSMVYNAVVQHHSGDVLSMQSFRDLIRKAHRTPAAGKHSSEAFAQFSLAVTGRFPTLKELDVYLVKEAMRRAINNQDVAAAMLGITSRTLNRLLRNMDGH